MENEKLHISFAALDPYIDTRIVSPKETKGAKFVEWGTANRYPHYLVDLFATCPTLRSIISGSADFAAGDDVTATRMLNPKQTPYEFAKEIFLYAFLFGGFAYQVIRGRDGQPTAVWPVNPSYLRTDEDNEIFYYSEKWNKGGRDAVVYPKFIKMERGIDDYHINALDNSFVSSLVVNFNNGVPSDEIKAEIERDFTEKFAGTGNAGRIMFSWNKSKETATTFQSVKVEDFGARYEALAKHSRQQIFTAFAASPVIFGIPTDNNGFSTDDYEGAYALYNKTRIRPAQRSLTESLTRVFGAEVLTITPFSLASADTNIQ